MAGQLPIASPVANAATAGGPGFGGHLRIASVLAPDLRTAVTALGNLGGADAAEVRLDGIWREVPEGERAADDLMALLDAAPVPLLATLRPVRQGGRFDGPEEVRVGLLAAAARAGFAAVDVEADVADAAGLVHALQADAQVIVSHHAPTAPNCDVGGRLLLSMQDRAAALDKLAFEASSFADTLRALELVRKHALRAGRPAVSTLGAGVAPVRALLALAGNRATYGHAPKTQPAAAGQPALAEVQAHWDHWGLGKGDLDALAQEPSPWLAVLGMPVLHSLSPRMHNAALAAAGRRERMGAMEVPASAAALRLVSMVATRIGLAGASVTAPHKADALRMGVADETARAVGAANCLRFGGTEPEGTNTDATALMRILGDHVDAGSPAVVVGAGGAARAAIWALGQLGAAVRFTSRDASRAAVVAASLGAKWTPWEERGDLAGQAWVQAASLDPTAPSPFAASQFRGSPLVVELAYKDGPSPFQREAEAAGCTVVDGRRMLLEQGADAYRFWFRAEPDRDAMAKSLAKTVEA